MTQRLRERVVIEKFKDLMKALYPESFVWKFHQGPMSGTGFPDLVVILDETTLFVEAKRHRERLTSMQEKILYNMRNAGGRCGVLRGGEDASLLILNPWRTDIEYVLDLDHDGGHELRDKIEGFIDDCHAGHFGVDGREREAD